MMVNYKINIQINIQINTQIKNNMFCPTSANPIWPKTLAGFDQTYYSPLNIDQVTLNPILRDSMPTCANGQSLYSGITGNTSSMTFYTCANSADSALKNIQGINTSRYVPKMSIENCSPHGGATMHMYYYNMDTSDITKNTHNIVTAMADTYYGYNSQDIWSPFS